MLCLFQSFSLSLLCKLGHCGLQLIIIFPVWDQVQVQKLAQCEGNFRETKACGDAISIKVSRLLFDTQLKFCYKDVCDG